MGEVLCYAPYQLVDKSNSHQLKGAPNVNNWRETWKRELHLHKLWSVSLFG